MNKLILISLFAVLVSCGNEEASYYPKPAGLLRLEFPERIYSQYESNCPFSFEMPDYFSIVDKDTFCNKKDVMMDRFNATLYLTYIPVDTNLAALIETSRRFAYEHSPFADAIEESALVDPSRDVYGLRYTITGNTASPYQFYVTDSAHHFLRGSFSFNAAPNYDSVKTSLSYITEDLDRMMETVTWKKDSSAAL